MKCLTIHQPWAELIARGDKQIENRTWPTSYRGPLLIHAGKSTRTLLAMPEWAGVDLPLGFIVARVELVDCLPLKAVQGQAYAEGPWCWILRGAQRITPVPCRGMQGLFESNLDPAILVQEVG